MDDSWGNIVKPKKKKTNAQKNACDVSSFRESSITCKVKQHIFKGLKHGKI